jgi:hypothetical protein
MREFLVDCYGGLYGMIGVEVSGDARGVLVDLLKRFVGFRYGEIIIIDKLLFPKFTDMIHRLLIDSTSILLLINRFKCNNLLIFNIK